VLSAGLTLLWLAGGLVSAHVLAVRGGAARIVYAGIVCLAGVIGVTLLLGASGHLTRPALIGTSATVAGTLVVLGLVRLRGRCTAALRADLGTLRAGLLAVLHPAPALLALAAIVVWSWAVAAIVYLPPRSVDDLCHHLGPVFQSIVEGRFVVFPLDLKPWFAYPLNADLLAAWSVLLRGDIAWTDGVQLPVAALAAATIVALARDLGATRRTALVAAQLFLLMPIVVDQATSAYTDLTLATVLATASWGAARYTRDGSRGALVTAALGVGLLAGMRYHFLFPLFAVAAVVIAGGMRHAPSRAVGAARAAAVLALPVLAFGAFWYVRNLIALGNPVYPYRLALGPLTLFPSALPATDTVAQSPTFLRAILRYPLLPFTVSLRDLGVGNVDGGFGPLFWGTIVPLGVATGAHGVWRAARRTATLPALVGILMLASSLPYLLAPAVMFEVQARYLLAPAILGFALAAAALDGVRPRGPRAAAGATARAVVAALVAVVPIADGEDLHARKQLMRFAPAAQAAERGDDASPWRFVGDAAYGVGAVSVAWDLLDALGTPEHPWWIYATGSYPAGFYGTRLQHRIWNVPGPTRPAEPDALVYHFERRGPGAVAYYGEPVIRWETVTSRPDLYDVVLATATVAVALPRQALASDATLRAHIRRWLEATHADATRLAAQLEPRPDGGVIVASGDVGLGL
jgi:hypothetical protein